MDTNVAGLNKVYCFVNTSNYNGKTVSITDGINTWTQVVADLGCVFMIPSIPAPAKRRYTVTLHNGDSSASALYTRTIDLGFGDSVRIGLYTNDEPVTKGTIPLATNSLTGGVRVNDTTSNGIYLDGNNISLKTATGSQKGGVKVPTGYGLYMDGMNLKAFTASPTEKGVVQIGSGMKIESGQIMPNLGDCFHKTGDGKITFSSYGEAFAFSSSSESVPANSVKAITVTKSSVSSDWTNNGAFMIGVFMPPGNSNKDYLIPQLTWWSHNNGTVTAYVNVYNLSSSAKTVGVLNGLYCYHM